MYPILPVPDESDTPYNPRQRFQEPPDIPGVDYDRSDTALDKILDEANEKPVYTDIAPPQEKWLREIDEKDVKIGLLEREILELKREHRACQQENRRLVREIEDLKNQMF